LGFQPKQHTPATAPCQGRRHEFKGGGLSALAGGGINIEKNTKI